MKFEQTPAEGYEHGVILESAEGEVEALSAVMMEHIYLLAKDGHVDIASQFQRDASEWSGSSDRTIFINNPLSLATMLETFHDRTKVAVQEIVENASIPAFENDSIARRIRLGNKAFQMAGLIKLEYDNDTLHQMLGEQGASMFDPAQAPKNPSN